MMIEDLIEQGKAIKQGMIYVNSPEGIIRLYDVYKPANVDEYYGWKERSIRFLQLYYPTDLERFVKYSEDFEKHHYIPRYISNMVGVLEACEVFPSEKMEHMIEVQTRGKEIEEVEELEKEYRKLILGDSVHLSSDAFHAWHAAACVLFDKWFYSTDVDWVKFQNIDGRGNGNVLNHYYDMIYSPYKKLMARLKEGRNIKGMAVVRKGASIIPNKYASKINIFISYSHADEKWLAILKKHLKVLERYSDSVEYWADTKLRGGDKWREEITAAICRANVAILLASTDFLASDFIASDELPPILRKAEDKGTRILPLIVSPCAFEISEISEFQAINNPERTLADLADDEAAINRVYLELIKNIQGLL